MGTWSSPMFLRELGIRINSDNPFAFPENRDDTFRQRVVRVYRRDTIEKRRQNTTNLHAEGTSIPTTYTARIQALPPAYFELTPYVSEGHPYVANEDELAPSKGTYREVSV